MDLGIKGKRALVLGGGKGIGRGIAEALAREGVDVAIASRNLKNLEAAAQDMARHGGRILPLAADVADHASLDAVYARVVEAFGGIDILVNNSGGPPPTEAAGVPDATWRAQFEAMVMSLIHLTELVLPGMKQRRWGRIMTIASMGIVEPLRNLAISNTFRAGLAGWFKTLANEIARDGITVNMLLPGTIRTQRIVDLWGVMAQRAGKTIAEVEADSTARIPVGRIGTIEEFGAVAAFIASTQASYVTGSMIRIDGGMIAST